MSAGPLDDLAALETQAWTGCLGWGLAILALVVLVAGAVWCCC